MSQEQMQMDAEKLIEFLHTDVDQPTQRIQIIHEDKIFNTNLDATLNYGNWRTGKNWKLYGDLSRVQILHHLLTEGEPMDGRNGHDWVSHVVVTNPVDNSIIITSTFDNGTKQYADIKTRFYSRGKYLYLAGMVLGVLGGPLETTKLHSPIILRLEHAGGKNTLVFPNDNKRYTRDGVGGWKLVDSSEDTTEELHYEQQGDAE